MSRLETLSPDSATPQPTLQASDAAMQRVLDALTALGGAPIETLTPDEARKQPSPADAAESVRRADASGAAVESAVDTTAISIPGAAGALEARVYRPRGQRPDPAFPVVVYFHGGGFVIADLDVYDGGPRGLSPLANAIVVSVHYRQAPEHQFPAAHDDAVAAYAWVLANAASLDGDPERVAVMGESAGGNLALHVAVDARDRGLQPPAHLALVYPVAGNDLDTASYREHANAKPLNKAMMEWFVKHTFADPSETSDPRINVVGAGTLHGLPDATIILAEIDPLRTEGELLAERMAAAGTRVRSQTFAGCTHEFFGMATVVPQALEAQMLVAKGLKRAFGNSVALGD